MIMQPQIEALRNEIGKPNSTKGRRVRAAAIRFQKHFADQEFNAEQFADWMATEPDMEMFATDHSIARKRLNAAGHRDDMPIPFEVARVAKSVWKLRPPEQLILSGDIIEEFEIFLDKKEDEVISALQACDIDGKDQLTQFVLLSFYRDFKRSKDMVLMLTSGIQEKLLQLPKPEHLALGAGDQN